ncbi:MAG: YgiT-type zinc finger protein [Candidatus Sumerlaeota bacterium]|nr:YgiT-type zinc finger protein [Candidatus Sumerlaeota bacterium]
MSDALIKKTKLEITMCPSCGGKNIKHLCRDWKDDWQGHIYTVPSLEYWKCPDCGEELYDGEAMRKIEEYCPAYAA